MATLTDVTRDHSQRLSSLARLRDERLRTASTERDRQLRSIPAAAKAYRSYEDEVAKIDTRRAADAAEAESTRHAKLEAAHAERREADAQAFEKRRIAEAAAERRFIGALAASPNKTSVDAQRNRADDLDRAREDFDDAVFAAQRRFREAVDDALSVEHRDATAALQQADKELENELESIPEAAAVIAKWRDATTVIARDYRRAESEEFERFHVEMEALRTS